MKMPQFKTYHEIKQKLDK